MTTGLPARVAICAVLMIARWAHPAPAPRIPAPEDAVTPERRQVAVIDLSEDDKVRLLDGELYKAIAASDTMMVPNNRGMDTYLTGSLYDEDQANIDGAKTARATALTELDEANSAGAEAAAKNGLGLLAAATPTAEVQAMYADLSFLAGLAALDQGKAQDANLALAHAHRLDPARLLSDARYPPNTIVAYRRALESRPQLVKIAVALDAALPAPPPGPEVRVWIDFVDRGPLGSFEGVEVGDHVVTLVGPTILTTGTPIRIAGRTTVLLRPIEASPEIEVKRARLALSRAQARHDDGARGAAMKQLATVVGIADAVLISKAGEGLQWETWRDGAGFSVAQAYTDQRPDDILEGLGPLRRPRPAPFVRALPDPRPVVETPWYRERWVQASVGAGIVAAIVGGILIATRTREIQFGNPGDIKDIATPSNAR